MSRKAAELSNMLKELFGDEAVQFANEQVSGKDNNLCGCGTCGQLIDRVCEEIIKNYETDNTCVKWNDTFLKVTNMIMMNVNMAVMCSNGVSDNEAKEELIAQDDLHDRRAAAIMKVNEEYIVDKINGPIQDARRAYLQRKGIAHEDE